MSTEAVAGSGRRVTSAYESLRAMLMSGAYGHGDALVEARIGTLLGVSRTPVREALARLESEGLVVQKANGTKVVADLWRRVAEVFEIRLRLEPLAVRLAAHTLTGTDLEGLEAMQREMEGLPAEGPAQLDRLVELNAGFHWRIVSLCDNGSLVTVLERLRPFSVFPRLLVRYRDEDRAAAIVEHRGLLEALWRRDQDRCEEITVAHLRRGRDAVAAVLGAMGRDPLAGGGASGGC